MILYCEKEKFFSPSTNPFSSFHPFFPPSIMFFFLLHPLVITLRHGILRRQMEGWNVCILCGKECSLIQKLVLCSQYNMVFSDRLSFVFIFVKLDYSLNSSQSRSRVAQSVQRLTTGWTVRDRIPVRTRFSARQDRPLGPPSLLYKGYRVYPGGKERPGRAADRSPPPSAAVMEGQSYKSTHSLGPRRACKGKIYLPSHVSIHFWLLSLITWDGNNKIFSQLSRRCCLKRCPVASFTNWNTVSGYTKLLC